MKTLACVSLYTLLLIASHGCILLLSIGAHANDNPVDKLLAVSAVDRQLETLPVFINLLPADVPALTAHERHALTQAMHRSFDHQRLRNSIRQALAARLSAADTDRILQWLETPAGKAITQRQAETAGRPGNLDALDIMALLGDEKRVALLYALDKATGASEHHSQLLLGVYRAMQQSLPVFVDTRTGEQLAQQSRMTTLSRLAATWHPLDEQTLKAYIRFANTDAGQRFFNIRNAALQEAYSQAARDFADGFARIQTGDKRVASALGAIQ